MVVFILAEEVERILVVQWETAEKGVRDFFKEEWVEDHYTTKSTVDLEEELVLMERLVVLVVGVATLVEAVEIIIMEHVGEGEDLITQGQISKMNAVTKQLAMVW